MALALFGGALLWSGSARAFHTEEQRITDDTAYTLRKKDFRVGLWKAQYGIWEPFMVGTYIWPWLFQTPNLHLKWRYYNGEKLALAMATGFFYLDTAKFKRLEDNSSNAKISVAPFELSASWRFNERFTLSLAPIWTGVVVNGEVDVDAFEGAGRGAVNNFQIASTFEWRVSRVTAFTAHWRYLVFQHTSVSGDFVSHPDEYTTIEVKATGSSNDLDFRAASSLTLSAVFSWETFNLRAGLGFGHYNVPAVNFVLPQPVLFPELDVYWIF